jgi:hypothetical protein
MYIGYEWVKMKGTINEDVCYAFFSSSWCNEFKANKSPLLLSTPCYGYLSLLSMPLHLIGFFVWCSSRIQAYLTFVGTNPHRVSLIRPLKMPWCTKIWHYPKEGKLSWKEESGNKPNFDPICQSLFSCCSFSCSLCSFFRWSCLHFRW